MLCSSPARSPLAGSTAPVENKNDNGGQQNYNDQNYNNTVFLAELPL